MSRRRFSLLAVALVICCSCATMQRRGALARANEAFNAGAYREALEHAKRAANYESDNNLAKGEALYLQARCHDALKETAEAAAIYQVLARDFGSTDFGSYAKKRLGELQR